MRLSRRSVVTIASATPTFARKPSSGCASRPRGSSSAAPLAVTASTARRSSSPSPLDSTSVPSAPIAVADERARVSGLEEDDLGVLGREHRARGAEQLTQRRPELGGVLHRSHRAVEEVDVLVPPPLGAVGAEGEHGDRCREGAAAPAPRGRRGQLDAGERDARTGEAAREREAGDARQVVRSRSGRVRDRDHDRHERRRRPARTRLRRRAPRSSSPGRPGLRGSRPVEDEQGEAGRKAGRGEVERRLVGRCRRASSSATAPPSSCPASSAPGEARNRPSTTASSLSERLCVSLRKSRWSG